MRKEDVVLLVGERNGVENSVKEDVEIPLDLMSSGNIANIEKSLQKRVDL